MKEQLHSPIDEQKLSEVSGGKGVAEGAAEAVAWASGQAVSDLSTCCKSGVNPVSAVRADCDALGTLSYAGK